MSRNKRRLIDTNKSIEHKNYKKLRRLLINTKTQNGIAVLCFGINSVKQGWLAAILIMKLILLFPAPKALETTKSVF
ncbi:hypothetical protein [Pseudanabaena sp. SR411]|uniref:hypothetical protein n=1 Tax=Pseudanabaena sp. SR411 TaxID=1980935 RepID=UPI001C3C7E5B|nr:hypothetical protein [Pseudanabaena sp. SR411]